MKNQKKNGMTREQAAELYKDLQKAMSSMRPGSAKTAGSKSASGIDAKAIAASISAAMKRDDAAGSAASTAPISSGAADDRPLPVTRGQYAALMFVLAFALARVSISALDYAGVGQASIAQASISASPPYKSMPLQPQQLQAQGFSRDEIKVLTALDGRRADLEERSRRLDDREQDIARRDREFAARMTQLREMTERLTNDRDKDDKKRSGQLEQLANVYGSMNPPEAATLIEQLDVTIALALLERMPEKRIGQILSLMSPERALAITKMLSGKIQ
jgi:flagellar motility protein MotE (MotC chaperone)